MKNIKNIYMDKDEFYKKMSDLLEEFLNIDIKNVYAKAA